ncbi:hypothetical protein SNL152K_8188 [Streptomyces sp. NL15-2K]|nr:hypothetical protein SNL152K_8188 [Streptomyces sp. NL15-2K]
MAFAWLLLRSDQDQRCFSAVKAGAGTTAERFSRVPCRCA